MMTPAILRDRRDAGEQLLARLPPLDGRTTVVLALPRGGVPVAAEIARAIHAPLDVVLVRKVGLPGHAELAVAAVADGAAPVYVVNQAVAASAGLSEADIHALAKPELAEIERRRRLWHGGRGQVDVAGKTAVVVDDGIATGATAKAALQALAKSGAARIILAVPVAPPSVLAELAALTDMTVCLMSPERFVAVGAYYKDFRQVSDREVAEALQAQARALDTAPP